MLILGLNGQARVGKDTTADHLVKNYGFLKISLADPIKRYAMSMFDLSYDQLWGDLKDKPDSRYPRICGHGHSEIKNCETCRNQPEYFCPREFVQFLGTEFGRRFYPNIWLDMLFRELKNHHNEFRNGIVSMWKYYPDKGFIYDNSINTGLDKTYSGAVIPDERFINEIDYMDERGKEEEWEVEQWRVKRPGLFVNSEVAKHSSESEQLSIPDSRFIKVLDNDGTIEDLYKKVDENYKRN
jgi:hypothetical protein